MKKCFILILLAACFCDTNAQTREDYDVLNQFLSEIREINKDNDIRIYAKSYAYYDGQRFFTKETFNTYLYSVPGLDNERFKEFINILDFQYLSNQKIKDVNWDFTKVKEKVVQYGETPEKFNSGLLHYAVSRPLYTQDKKTAFIFYLKSCGYLCNSWSVRIYFKKGEKWCFYEQLPLTL
jgi:hypothetical protein